MLHRVASSRFTPDEREEHQAKFGGYNDPPPNFQPCDPDEFHHWFSSYGFFANREFRQFVVPGGPNKWVESVYLYYGKGDAGYATFYTYEYSPESKAGYKYTVHYYKFYICDHEVKHTRNLGRCYNEYQCTKCGWTYAVDSSD